MVESEETLLGIQIFLWIFLIVIILIYKQTKSKIAKWIAVCDVILALVDLATLLKLEQ